MVLPYKTGIQDIIDFIKYLETRPVGVIFGGVKKAIKTKSIDRFVISFAGASAERIRVSPLFP